MAPGPKSQCFSAHIFSMSCNPFSGLTTFWTKVSNFFRGGGIACFLVMGKLHFRNKEYFFKLKKMLNHHNMKQAMDMCKLHMPACLVWTIYLSCRIWVLWPEDLSIWNGEFQTLSSKPANTIYCGSEPKLGVHSFPWALLKSSQPVISVSPSLSQKTIFPPSSESKVSNKAKVKKALTLTTYSKLYCFCWHNHIGSHCSCAAVLEDMFS